VNTTDRKTLIADAAIALLGMVGAKGLTHRAVDVQAGLPLGSSSFYCRTRQDLLTLTLQRHAALDLLDLQEDAARMQARGFTQALFLEVLMARLAVWMSPERRPRLVARFQLILMAAGDPALAETMAAQRRRFLQATEAGLMQLGIKEAAQRAPMLVATVDGILLDHIHAGTKPLLTTGHLRQMLQAFLMDTR
jgi:DNA-binding transcriptional regulator YbjK